MFTTSRSAASRRPLFASLAALSAAALCIVVVACSDGGSSSSEISGVEPGRTASSAPASTSSNKNLIRIQGLLRTTPLAQPVVVIKTLSHGGGGITVPGTDFQLQVPNGAFVGNSMTFKITAYAGNVVAYDFEPHGVVFLKPLKAVQQLGHTNWKSLKLPAGYYPFSGAYFADSSLINLKTGRGWVNELMPSGVNVGGATMTWSIPHFSGYLVATGFEDQ